MIASLGSEPFRGPDPNGLGTRAQHSGANSVEVAANLPATLRDCAKPRPERTSSPRHASLRRNVTTYADSADDWPSVPDELSDWPRALSLLSSSA